MIDNPIILALDYADMHQAYQMVDKVRPHIGMIKIGLELFSSWGMETFRFSKDFNIPIFLDLKLHDIPKTVEKTIGVLCERLAVFPGDHFLSVHCLGGKEMCKASLEASKGSNVTIAGVTILTSLSDDDLRSFGMKNPRAGAKTIVLAEVGKAAGLNHFVCAPNQLELMNKHYKNLILITPGIRAPAAEPNDHQRSKTISFAIKNGAGWVVVGRPITQAVDPEYVVMQLKHQVDRSRV